MGGYRNQPASVQCEGSPSFPPPPTPWLCLWIWGSCIPRKDCTQILKRGFGGISEHLKREEGEQGRLGWGTGLETCTCVCEVMQERVLAPGGWNLVCGGMGCGRAAGTDTPECPVLGVAQCASLSAPEGGPSCW